MQNVFAKTSVFIISKNRILVSQLLSKTTLQKYNFFNAVNNFVKKFSTKLSTAVVFHIFKERYSINIIKILKNGENIATFFVYHIKERFAVFECRRITVIMTLQRYNLF